MTSKARLPWGIAILTILLGIAGLVIAVLNGRQGTSMVVYLLDRMVPAFVGWAYAPIGALIASRDRRNLIGWAFVGIGLIFSSTLFGQEYFILGLETPGLPGSRLLGWFQHWSLSLAFPTGITLLFLLFPTGRLPSRRWRLVAWLSVALALLFAVSGMVDRTITPSFTDETDLSQTAPNPITGGRGYVLPNAIANPAWGLAMVLMFVAAISLFIRYQRASQVEKTQLRLLAIVAVAGPLSFIISSTGLPVIRSAWVFGVLVFAFGFPLAALMTIVKHRMFDVEVLVSKGVLYGTLATLLTILYVGVVVGIGALLGRAGQPSLGLSMLAAAFVAIAFQPIRNRIQRFANRVVFGKRANPYEVLSEFSDKLSSTYTGDVLKEMARLIGEGMGADRSEVWLKVGDEVRLEESWSPNGTKPSLGAEAIADVVHGDEVLGRLAIYLPPAEPPSEDQRRLLNNLASQAGFVLRNVKLVEDLRSSRQRIVAAQDEERRRMERDLHDGAQQQLVALKVQLGLVERLSAEEKVKTMLGRLQSSTDETIDALRDLARGIYPPVLVDQGLAAALNVQASKAHQQVSISQDGIGRYPQAVEAAVYFCCLEALQNAAKYAGDAKVEIRLHHEDASLTFLVRDEGRGFDPKTVKRGAGLQNMADRIEALGGTLAVASSPGGGTLVTGTVPVSESQAES